MVEQTLPEIIGVINETIAQSGLSGMIIEPEVLTDILTTGVQGDGRTRYNPLILKIKDGHCPHQQLHELLTHISTCITNQFPINKVLLDITNLPQMHP